MRVTVAGDVTKQILLSTTKATALLIQNDDGTPAVIYKMLPDGKGYIRLHRGEDQNFDEIAKQLGLT